jgi:hypothetical protein
LLAYICKKKTLKYWVFIFGLYLTDYEDAYPNYESPNEEGGKGGGKRKSGEDGKPLYDDEIQGGGKKQQGQQPQEEAKPATASAHIRDGESELLRKNCH